MTSIETTGSAPMADPPAGPREGMGNATEHGATVEFTASDATIASTEARKKLFMEAAVSVGQPVVTYALLATMALFFVLQMALDLDGVPSMLSPEPDMLVTLGGNIGSLTLGSGQFYRLATSIFLHGSPIHLLMNGIALYLAGQLLERILGRWHFLALFMIGGICGSLASLAWNPENLVSIGASGAITGCFGGLVVSAFQFQSAEIRSRFLRVSAQVLIPSVLPFLNAHSGMNIDYADHIGGILGGVVYAGFLMLVWRQDDVAPRAVGVGMVISLGLLLLAVVGFGLVAVGPQPQSLLHQIEMRQVRSGLAPPQFTQQLPEDAGAAGERFVASYPGDPRGYVLLSSALADREDFVAAEANARRGLALDRAIDQMAAPGELRDTLTMVLAIARQGQHQDADAKAIAAPLCGKSTKQAELLRSVKLCPAPSAP